MTTIEEFFGSRNKKRSFPPPPMRKTRKKRGDVIHEPLVNERNPIKRGLGSAYQHTKTGYREDINVVTRSAWEANVIRALKLCGIKWEFEPIQFNFPGTEHRMPSAYLPDIYLKGTDEYVEVKGYLDSRGRSKLRKFKKHYPAEFAKLIVVISKSNKKNKIFFDKLGVKQIVYYEDIKKELSPLIPTWE